MEIITPKYYDISKFSNTYLLGRMALEEYFGNNVFKGDGSRIIYASPQFAFRQRLNLLAKAGNSSIEALDLPFMSYFRQGGWQLDKRVGLPNALSTMAGRAEEAIDWSRLRFMNVEANFDCWMFFYNDIDAQIAQETLLYIKYPSRKQFSYGSVTYKNVEIQIPMTIDVDNIDINPGLTERDWLQANRVIPVHFTTNIKSVAMSQIRQYSNGEIFDPITGDDIHITEHVLLDFLTYKYSDDYFDKTNIVLEVDSTIDPDPILDGSLFVKTFDSSSITLGWNYNAECEKHYYPNITVSCDNGTSATPLMTAKEYVFSNLKDGSTYNFFIYFTARSGGVTKYSARQTTVATNRPSVPGMKGMKKI